MKGYLLVLFVLICAGAGAQTSKGSFLIGGSAALQKSSYEYANPTTGQVQSSSTIGYSLAPTVGFFPVTNLMAGVRLSTNRNWDPSNKNYGNSSTGIGPLIRYYFPFGKFAVFPEVSGLITRSTVKTMNYNSGGQLVPVELKSNYTTYTGGAGVAWFVTPNIGIEGILSYRQSNIHSPSSTQTSFGVNFGIQFYLPSNTQ